MSDSLGLIPTPRRLVRGVGTLELPPRVAVMGPDAWADALAAVVGPGSGVRFLPAGDGTATGVSAALGVDGQLPGGGYRLNVEASGLRIAASDDDGFFAAVATLRQLLPAWSCGQAPVPGEAVTLPVVEIEDAPRFAWRGMLLDVGRHFQPLGSLFQFVDVLALHKFNRFHLHLSEDQGWRFEVRKYPRLTEVGSWRTETRYPLWSEGDGTPHGGFYTQDQLRALVGYAAQRGITIVPEIDLPGHVRALLAAYPEFGEPGAGALPVATTFGVFNEVLHLSDATVAMIEDVFTELLEVFPSEYIHIGGDECPTTQWESSTAAQQLAAARGLADVRELQRWLTLHLRDWLEQRGRRLVGWDEIVEKEPLPGAVVMSWRSWLDPDPGIAALEAGNEVVMAPSAPLYFDHYPSADPREAYSIGGHNSWQQVLAYDPARGVADEQLPRLLGVQAQLWSEYLPTPERVQYMAFPRAAALAEVAWAQMPMSEQAFEARFAVDALRLGASGFAFRPLDGPLPWQQGGTGRYARPAGQPGSAPDADDA